MLYMQTRPDLSYRVGCTSLVHQGNYSIADISRGVVALFRTSVRNGRGASISGVESITNLKDEHACCNNWRDV